MLQARLGVRERKKKNVHNGEVAAERLERGAPCNFSCLPDPRAPSEVGSGRLVLTILAQI